MDPIITLFICLIAATVIIAGFIVYVTTRKSHGQHPTRIGRYRVIKELPAGGMSRIFLGRRADDKHIIIKIPLESIPQEDTLSKFLEEGKVLSLLHHPHIVGLEEYGRITINKLQTGFVTLEYVEGMSLDKLIRGGKKFSPQAASLIISSVADALETAHKAGIYHRDISTNNIILTYDGNKIKEIKLIDFGIAKWQAGSEHTLKDMMKEHYASPEQITRENLDGGSDIYSLGIVYYELITGRKPFETWDRKKLPLSPVNLGLNIPENIDRLIMQMLAPDKEQRIRTAYDVIQQNKVSALGGALYAAAARTGSQKQGSNPVFWSLSPAFSGKSKYAMASMGSLIIVFALIAYAINTTTIKISSETTAAKANIVPTSDSPKQVSVDASGYIVKKCPKCGAMYQDKDLKYCTKDGTLLEENLIKAALYKATPAVENTPTVAEVASEAKECPKCGTVYRNKDYKFCTKDGTTLVAIRANP